MYGRIHGSRAQQLGSRPGGLAAAAGAADRAGRCTAVKRAVDSSVAQPTDGCSSLQHSYIEQQHSSTGHLFQQQQQQQRQQQSCSSSLAAPAVEAFYIPSGQPASGDAAAVDGTAARGGWPASSRQPWLGGAQVGGNAAIGKAVQGQEACSSTSTSSNANNADTATVKPVAARPGSKQQRHTKSSMRKQKANNNSSSSSRSGSREALLASKRLTSNISQAGSWQQLQALLEQHGDRMNHIHAAALLGTTSKLVQHHLLQPQQQQEFMGFYAAALQLAYAQAHQGSARPRELSSMLWSVAKVGLHPGQEWLGAYLAAVQPQLGAMNAQDLGLLVWALARFQLTPQPGFCSQLLQAAAAQLAATTSSSSGSSGGGSTGTSSSDRRTPAKGFDSQGLCNVVWGLAVLELNPGQAWLSQAAAAAGHLLQRRSFKPQGIAVLLWAFAKLGFRPQQQWLREAADAATQQLYAFKPAELSMLCHALARLHYQPPQAQQQQQQQVAASVQQQQQQGTAAVQQLGQSLPQQPQLNVDALQAPQQQQPLLEQVQCISWSQLRCLHFAEAANLVWAMGVVGQRTQPEWVQGAVQQLQRTLQEADAKALASACHGLAKLQHPAGEEWWQAVWQHAPRLLCAAATGDPITTAARAGAAAGAAGAAAAAPGVYGSSQFEPEALSQSVATFMWALTKMGVQPPADVAGSLLAASQQLLQQQAANAAEVMAMTVAAAVLQLQPQQSWLVAAEEMLGVLLLHCCSEAQLAGDTLLGVQHAQQQQGAVSCHSQQQGQEGAVVQEQQATQQLEVLQQQQQEHQQQQQQQQTTPLRPAARLRAGSVTPKEIANTVFSLARLRHVPGVPVLSALQQYVQQYSRDFAAADWQQLQRALQSWGDQLQLRNRQAQAAAAAAAAAAAGSSAQDGVSNAGADALAPGRCQCGAHDSSSQQTLHASGPQQVASCWHAGELGSLMAPAAAAAAMAAAGGSEELCQQQRGWQLLPGHHVHLHASNSNTSGAAGSSTLGQAPEDDQLQHGLHALAPAGVDMHDDDLQPAEESMLVYGHYLSLPVRANSRRSRNRGNAGGSGGSSSNSSSSSSVSSGGFMGCAALELAV